MEGATEEDDLDGIGGWLILVGIGIVISPFRIIFMVVPEYSALFSDGTWGAISNSGSESYNLALVIFVVSEMLVNCFLVFCWVYIGYLFCTLNPRFPYWHIFIMIFTGVVIIVDAAVMKIFLPGGPLFDSETFGELAKHAVATAIWVPYMLISERVRITFGREEIE